MAREPRRHILWPYYRREGEGKDARVVAEVRSACDKENRRRRADLLKARFVHVFPAVSTRSGDAVSLARDAVTGDVIALSDVCSHCWDRFCSAKGGRVLR